MKGPMRMVLEALAKARKGKGGPPPNYVPMKNSKKGGFRNPVTGASWYPGDPHPQQVPGLLAAAKTLVETENVLRRVRDREYLAVFDASGKRLTVVTGERARRGAVSLDGRIVVSNSGLALVKRRGSRVTHNHPRGSLPSAADLVFALTHRLAELRVVTSDGVWSFEPEGGGRLPALTAKARSAIAEELFVFQGAANILELKRLTEQAATNGRDFEQELLDPATGRYDPSTQASEELRHAVNQTCKGGFEDILRAGGVRASLSFKPFPRRRARAQQFGKAGTSPVQGNHRDGAGGAWAAAQRKRGASGASSRANGASPRAEAAGAGSRGCSPLSRLLRAWSDQRRAR